MGMAMWAGMMMGVWMFLWEGICPTPPPPPPFAMRPNSALEVPRSLQQTTEPVTSIVRRSKPSAQHLRGPVIRSEVENVVNGRSRMTKQRLVAVYGSVRPSDC